MKLNRVTVTIGNILFVISPLIIAAIGTSRMSGDTAQAAGMYAGFFVFPLVMVFAVVGLLITFFTRKSDDALKYSLMAFGVPSGALLFFVVHAYLLNSQ